MAGAGDAPPPIDRRALLSLAAGSAAMLAGLATTAKEKPRRGPGSSDLSDQHLGGVDRSR